MNALLACWMLLACASGAAESAAGYVVKVESQAVILDFNEKTGAAVGQGFSIFQEGEELKHPATGKSLGRLEKTVAEGSLREIFPQYSVGALSSIAAPVAVGMRARLKPLAAAAPPAPMPAPAPRAETPSGGRQPLWRGPSFDYPATALAVADCRGDATLAAAVSDGKNVYLYAYPPQDAKPLAQFAAPGTAPRILSLEAADINGNGRAEIFASLYNDALARFETVVLELDPAGQLTKIADLSFLVRGFQDAAGRPQLATQQVTSDASFPFGAIYPLTYQDGRYAPGKPAVAFTGRKPDWVFDFTLLTLDGKPATAFLTNREVVRVQFKKGSFKTPEDYCQTPNRVRWSGDRLLQFRPRLPALYDEKGFAGIFLVKNIAAFGGLAGPFGIFSRAQIERLNWNGVALAQAWNAPLGGYCAGISLVSSAAQAPQIAVLVVGTAGQSSLWAYEP